MAWIQDVHVLLWSTGRVAGSTDLNLCFLSFVLPLSFSKSVHIKISMSCIIEINDLIDILSPLLLGVFKVTQYSYQDSLILQTCFNKLNAPEILTSRLEINMKTKHKMKPQAQNRFGEQTAVCVVEYIESFTFNYFTGYNECSVSHS